MLRLYHLPLLFRYASIPLRASFAPRFWFHDVNAILIAGRFQ